MYQLPARLAALTPYQPLCGDFSIRLDANESFFSLPDDIRQEIAQAVAGVAFNRYPDPYCTALCQAFGAFYHVDPALTVAGNGSDELISLVVSSFAAQGETMVTVSPDFSMYGFYAQLSGFRQAVYQKTDELRLDAQELISFCKQEDARLLLFSNPCNPTSLCASRQEIIEVVTSLPDCLVVVDEAYMDFWEGSVLDQAGQLENLLVLKTCSKALGMAAVRLGFAVGAPVIANALRAVKSPYNVNAMTQAAGCILFSHREYIESCIAEIKASRNWLYERLRLLSRGRENVRALFNTHANFLFLQLWNSKQVFEMAASSGIALRLMGEYLRISAGSEAENKRVISLLEPLL